MRLELLHAAARPTTHEVADAGFLIGSVPGCDLRLPGADLPPVLCLITRDLSSVTLRKLAPVQSVLLNGRPVNQATLGNGDRVTIGAVQLRVSIEAVAAAVAPPVSQSVAEELQEQSRQLDVRAEKLAEQARDLENERDSLSRHREQIEQEARQQQEAGAALLQKVQQLEQELQQREQAVEQRAAELDRQQADVAAGSAQLAAQQDEFVRVRQELASIRQQFYERYRQRRDRLSGLHEAVRRAARKLQERKRDFESQYKSVTTIQEQEAARQAAYAAACEALERDRQRLAEQQRLLEAQRQEWEEKYEGREQELQQRERRLAEERRTLEKNQAQYQADLVQLVRLEGSVDEKRKRLQAHALEVDRGFERLQHDSRELEEQAVQIDEWHARVTAGAETFERRKAELDATAAEMAQRAATLEGQQAMLATLRTRLERMREELRREEQQLAEQRGRQEAEEAELQQRLRETTTLRAELASERHLGDSERKRFEDRQAVLDSAVAQLRQAQEALAAEQERVRQDRESVDIAMRDQAEQAALVRARSDQVKEQQQRLAAEREALAEREQRLARGEQALSTLQEQVRRRSEELVLKEKAITEEARQHTEQIAALQGQRVGIEQERQQAEERLAPLRRELDERKAELEREAAALEARVRELDHRQETLHRHLEGVKETDRLVKGDREALASEQERWRAERQSQGEAQAALEAARSEAAEWQRQLPELELRARTALDRLAQAREQLREQLAEVHTYAAQSRDDLEALQTQVQAEAERIRQQDAALHRTRDEHRLAVAAFRQQLIEWQGQLAEIKRSLAQDETRLERRQAEVEAQFREVDATTARLAEQAEQLQQRQREVSEQHDEMHRHLADMREWYRRKLRELAGSRATEAVDAAVPPSPHPLPASASEPDILSLTGDVEPGDRQLGELLRSLELVDADTLTTLLAEARRQRRSLRQLLLSGGYLTLYQMALIEAGNVAGLVLGPVRVVDRLRATPCEVVYRVFDPRRSREALLRHLTEAESEDAVHPDEFRQRFAAAAAVQHPHVAATLEVLEIAGRPAVLQEWLSGLPSTDWPALAAVPGVWFRLLNQAALGLHTAHQGGLVHGRLEPGLVVLTGDGTVKLCGFGEPAWLGSSAAASEGDVAGDLLALGRIAAGWAALTAERKTARTKPLPEGLQGVLKRLTAAEVEERYASAAALLEELDRAGADVPANAAAWERLLREVREQAVDVGLRLSA